MQRGAGGNDAIGRNAEMPAIDISDHATRLGDQQAGGQPVRRILAHLNVAIQPASRHISQLQRGGRHAAATARGLDLLRALADVTAAYQLRRPRLAHQLDEHEATLPPHYRDAEVHAVAVPLVLRALAELLPPAPAGIEAQALDLIAITRALTDAAGARGERDEAALSARIMRAISGYLNLPPAPR